MVLWYIGITPVCRIGKQGPSPCSTAIYKGEIMHLLVKPRKNMERGKVLVIDHQRIVSSYYYCNMDHRLKLVDKLTRELELV